MNILYVTESTLIGGAETQMLALFRGLLSQRFEVRLLCCGGSFAEEARSIGLDVHTLDRRLSIPIGIARAVHETQRLCEMITPHVVHAEGVRASVVVCLARRRLQHRPGIVVTVHNLTVPGSRSYAIASPLLRMTGGFLTTVSESERLRYIRWGFPPDRCRTIHNGVMVPPELTAAGRNEAREALGLSPKALVIAHVGRLNPHKGHSILMHALAGLPELGTPFKVLFAGDGPLRDDLEKLSVTLRVADKVLFLGFRKDVPVLLRASDLLVLPSLTEAFPMALLEAMALGLPVIATRVGGVPELVTDGTEGWLVPAGDAAVLRHALIEAFHDRSERVTRGNRARARVAERFTFERMMSETLAIYREVSRPNPAHPS